MSQIEATPQISQDPILLVKAKTLLESHFFVGMSESAPGVPNLNEKQCVFLVLAGCKQLSQATSGRIIHTKQGWHSVPEDHTELGDFLRSLGLAYRLSDDEWATDALVGLDQKSIDAASGPMEQDQIGTLFGYPVTACAAYPDGSMSIAEQEQKECEAGLMDFIVPFRLSQQHWQEELKAATLWAQVLRSYGMV